MAADSPPLAELPPQPVEMALGPLTIRGLALSTILAAAALFVLHEGAPVLVPLFVSILLSYTLEPVVSGLVGRGVPRVGAAILVYVVAAILAFAGARALRNQVMAFIDDLPHTIAAVQDSLPSRRDHSEPNTMDRLRQAAQSIEQATRAGTPAAPGVARVSVVRSPFDVRDYLLSMSQGVVTVATQLIAIALLTFLLLATGDLFKRKLVKMAGPAFADRKITVEVLRSVDRQIERYLIVRALISGIVAAATAVAAAWLGVEHAVVWGIVAGALNVLPFIGPTVAVVLIALAAFVQFRTAAMAGAAGGAAAIVAAVEGNVLTPLLMSRAGELNTVAVFVSVLVWGWLWGVWGLLLAVPIMVAVKAVADQIESLKAIGELLGR